MECVILKLVDGHHIAVSGEPEGHLCYCVTVCVFFFYKDMKIFFTCACHFFMDNSFLQGHENIFYFCVSFFSWIILTSFLPVPGGDMAVIKSTSKSSNWKMKVL